MGVMGSRSKSNDKDGLFDNVEKQCEKSGIKQGELVKDLGYAIKLVAVGGRESGIGRILDIYRGIDHEDEEAYSGVDFFTKEISFDDISIRATIWDYRMSNVSNLIESVFRGSNGIIVGYDPSIQSTFEGIPKWVEECKKNISPDKNFNEKCQVVIVAKTKKKSEPKEEEKEEKEEIDIGNPYAEFNDFLNEERVVSEESAKGYAENSQYLYYEVNVDEPSNIDEPFVGITRSNVESKFLSLILQLTFL